MLKEILESEAKQYKNNSVGVLLSAGVDSQSVLFSLLSVGNKPVVYSFTLDNHESKDYLKAKEVARKFNLKFVPIILPTNLDILKMDLKRLKNYGATNKVDFECGFPMLYAYPTIKEKIVASGMAADANFCLSKKGMLHYKDRLDDFRDMMFNDPKVVQINTHTALAKKYNKIIWFPYLGSNVRKHFRGTTWDEINKPKQKQPIRDTYPEWFKISQPTLHVNLQKGDSGIDDLFHSLIYTDWNIGNFKSVKGILNAVVKGKV